MNDRSGEPIPCFTAEQGIASKALGLRREMTVRLAKTVKKDQKSANFPVLFPVLRESGPRAFSRVACEVDAAGRSLLSNNVVSDHRWRALVGCAKSPCKVRQRGTATKAILRTRPALMPSSGDVAISAGRDLTEIEGRFGE
jgi:hypothetical protein